MQLHLSMPPLASVALIALAACASVGPGTIPRDQFDYGEAMSKSLKEQMLLNIVRARYLDAPMFVEVASVITQYELEGEATVGSNWSDGLVGDTVSVGGRGRYSDRPTITYSPVVGKEFTRSVMTPLPPGAVMFLIQSGWSADFVLGTCVQVANGNYNRGGAPALGISEPDPAFVELLGSLRRIQRSGAVGMRVEDPASSDAAVLILRRREDPDLLADLEAFYRILGLDPARNEFRIVYGADATADDVIALQTRSILELMVELASQVDVPPEHVAEGRTYASTLDGPQGVGRLAHIRCSESRPPEAFVSVRYRDQWFWIDDRDMNSKRTFSFLMVLFNLTQTGESAVPLLTVGAG